MALHINNKSDWNEMFDKFATMPKDRDKAAAEPKKEDDNAKAAADKAQSDRKA